VTGNADVLAANVCASPQYNYKK